MAKNSLLANILSTKKMEKISSSKNEKKLASYKTFEYKKQKAPAVE